MENRIAKLQEQLESDSAFCIQSPENRRYLTGFSSSAGCVLVTKTNSWFFTDFRYLEKAKQQISHCLVEELVGIVTTLSAKLKEHKVTRLFVETGYVSLQEFLSLRTKFEGIQVQAETRLDDVLQEMRMIKSQNELLKIQEAQRLTDETFSYILERIQPGRSEIDVMLDMEFYMRKLGSEGVSFDFIVVSGENSSLPHGVPTQKVVEEGDFVTMDFGAVVDGYHSDMTRTVGVGTLSEHQRQVYETVLQAKKCSMERIQPGKICKDIDKVARDMIANAGFDGCFGHGLGHGVGLEIHENPSFNTRCETLLKPGMILTVEPGIYLENQFGVRIEDMIVVTENGYTNLTKSTDQLIVL